MAGKKEGATARKRGEKETCTRCSKEDILNKMFRVKMKGEENKLCRACQNVLLNFALRAEV